MRGGMGGGMFNIGKSKAQVYDSKNAQEVSFKDVAGLEGAKEEVEEIYYAGTGIISFTVNSVDTALKLLRNIKLITFAESLGGTESLLTYPTVQTHPDVPEEQKLKLGITDRLLRLSVGIENPKDIIADLEGAFHG